MYRVRTQIGCDKASDAIEIKEIPTVAVLDTGVMNHPDLQGRIVCFKDFMNDKDMIYDDSGHGTHVCGIIGGNGKASAGKFRGIAPKTKLIVGKVLDKDGNGTADAMLEGIRWIIDNRNEYNIRILNVSIGIGQLKNSDKEKQLIEGLNEAWDEGILVVCAAGNGGPEVDTISKLARGRKIITVGCHDGEFYKNMPVRCELYSARGDENLLFRKPDIVAPGTEIISCNAEVKKSARGYFAAYIKKSGTSMATPIVSGALSLLLAIHPEYKNEHAKKQLLYSAMDLGEPWHKQGYGMVNVWKLLQ